MEKESRKTGPSSRGIPGVRCSGSLEAQAERGWRRRRCRPSEPYLPEGQRREPSYLKAYHALRNSPLPGFRPGQNPSPPGSGPPKDYVEVLQMFLDLPPYKLPVSTRRPGRPVLKDLTSAIRKNPANPQDDLSSGNSSKPGAAVIRDLLLNARLTEADILKIASSSRPLAGSGS